MKKKKCNDVLESKNKYITRNVIRQMWSSRFFHNLCLNKHITSVIGGEGGGRGEECPQRLSTGKFLVTYREKWGRWKGKKCEMFRKMRENGEKRMKIRKKIKGRRKMINIWCNMNEKSWGPFSLFFLFTFRKPVKNISTFLQGKG